MATLLLIVIYIAFIGLGIPDSLFGAAWPAIYGEFNLPVSYANFVTLTTSLCTFISSLISARVINRFGTDKVTAVSTALTAVAIFTMSFSGNYFFMPLLAIPLGLGAGAIDSGLNNYVALHYNAMQMNFLHCFYGMGVSLSPYLLSFALSGAGGWRAGYRTVAIIQMIISVIVIVTLPIWKKSGHAENDAKEELPKTLSAKEIFAVKGLFKVWMMFFTACAIEFCCGIWGSTFLVEYKGVDPALASKIMTLYYIGIAVGRFLSGVLSVKISAKGLVVLGQGVIAAAVVFLFLPFSPAFSAIGLFLAGLGVSPIYPNLMHLTPQFFGRSVSQSVMGTQMAAACLGIMLTPALFGLLAQYIGLGVFPIYILVIFALLVFATATSKVKEK